MRRLIFLIATALAFAGCGLAAASPALAASHVRGKAVPLLAVGDGDGTFLTLSDIHFDPFVDGPTAKKLAAAPVEQWPAILAAQKKLSPYGADTDAPLLRSTLRAAKSTLLHYDFVLVPGDILAHDFDLRFQRYVGGDAAAYASFVEKTSAFVYRSVQAAFPGTPIVFTMGNNDAICGDYKIAPNSALFASLADEMHVFVGQPEARRTFLLGGYYAIPHPTVANRLIVVLNDVFWSTEYQDACSPEGGDPGADELAWLAQVLEQAQRSGMTVTLLMHIPPGINAYSSTQNPGDCRDGVTPFWKDAYAEKFLALAGSYANVLRDAFAGHTHMDDFRVYAAAGSSTGLPIRITPSISPVFANNPGFSVVLYRRGDGALLDYVTLRLDLAEGGTPLWTREYDFRAIYGYADYSAGSLEALSAAIRNDPSVRAHYTSFYAGESSATSPITPQNWTGYVCAQTQFSEEGFAACYCPAVGGRTAPTQP